MNSRLYFSSFTNLWSQIKKIVKIYGSSNLSLGSILFCFDFSINMSIYVFYNVFSPSHKPPNYKLNVLKDTVENFPYPHKKVEHQQFLSSKCPNTCPLVVIEDVRNPIRVELVLIAIIKGNLNLEIGFALKFSNESIEHNKHKVHRNIAPSPSRPIYSGRTGKPRYQPHAHLCCERWPPHRIPDKPIILLPGIKNNTTSKRMSSASDNFIIFPPSLRVALQLHH